MISIPAGLDCSYQCSPPISAADWLLNSGWFLSELHVKGHKFSKKNVNVNVNRMFKMN